MADATVVYQDLGISYGMAQGIAQAGREGRPVEYRRLPKWEAAPERLVSNVEAEWVDLNVSDDDGGETVLVTEG